MTIAGISRYRDLVNNVVKGDYYLGNGIILPYKTVATQLRLETGQASTKFGLYLNELFVGEYVSDVEGNIVFSYRLPLGEVAVTVLNTIDGRKITTYVTVRDWALWLAAYAEVLETLDDDIQQIQNDLSIETATLEGIEDHFGKYLGVYNDMGQSLGAYRWMLHELRSGFRNGGSRFGGIDDAVGVFTQVPPFGYTRRFWGPSWILDQSMLVNHRYLNRSHDIYTIASPSNITGVTVTKVEPDVRSVTVALHTLDWNVAANTLIWSPEGVAGPAVQAVDGEIFLPGPSGQIPDFLAGFGLLDRPAFALGRDISVTPYAVTGGVNDELYLDIDEIGTINVTLTTGLPAPTPANVATDINTALTADARYGAGYATATTYNTKLLVISPTSGVSSVFIENGTDNAAAGIFGVKPGNLTFDPNPLDGVVIADFSGYFPVIGAGYQIEYEYDGGVTPATKKLRFNTSFAAPWGAGLGYVSVPEDGVYILYDTVGNEVHVECVFDDMEVLVAPFPATDLAAFDVGFQRLEKSVDQNLGLWVTCDTDSLPVGNQTDTVKVYDDVDDGFIEMPDNWYIDSPTAFVATCIQRSEVTTGKLEELDPNPAFKFLIDDSSITSIQITGRIENFTTSYPNDRGGNYPQKSSNLFYDYEGFTAEFSVWLKNLTVNASTATLSFSFDDQGSWVSGAPTAIVSDPGGDDLEDATQVSFSTIIPSAVTDNGVWVMIQLDTPGGAILASVDSPSVGVKYISSRYLTDATVCRDRHHQYFGELLWAWCPDQLTLKEKEYLGMRHKLSDRTTVYSGVVISNVSLDTANGAGTLDFDYDATLNKKSLRWNTYDSAWAIGLGWVVITGNGTYDLAAPDGSYITVTITYSVMPTTDDSKTVTISDETINQGITREIAPAHSALAIHDTTEYNALNVPINVKGSIYEGDFTFGTMENLEIVATDPYRFAYMIPTDLPVEGESLTIATPAPHLATLNYNSDEDQTEAILYEDGIPVSNDSWAFTASNQIQVLAAGLSPYNASAVYTIDYGLLYQFTTPYIDLSAGTYQDYAWFVDYYLWSRFDNEEGTYSVNVPVYFSSTTGRATLSEQSDMNTSTANLYIQDGTDYRVVPKRYWRFRDKYTIEMGLDYMVAGAQYYLEHYEVRVYEQSNLTVTFEHRSGVNSAACAIAAWADVERNENVDVHTANDLVHQLRLTVAGIRDLRDFKMRALVLKGLHIHGANPDVVGLTNIWGL